MRQLILIIFSLLGLFSGTAYANDKMTVLLDWFVNPDHGLDSGTGKWLFYRCWTGG